MTRSNQDDFSELLSLSWMALKQADTRFLSADAETLSFFSSEPSPKIPRLAPTQPVPSQPVAEEVSVSPSPSKTKRLEKLLPRPSSRTETDTTDVRKQVLSKTASLSDVPLYTDPLPRAGPKQWTLFTHITPATPREPFVRSIASAIGERLKVRVVEHLCTGPLFALELPMAIDDSEVVLLIVDAHLESSLHELLEPIHSFTSSSQIFEPPFSVMGSINGKPLRTLVLHPSTHEDQAVKAQLWRGLQALATLKSPY